MRYLLLVSHGTFAPGLHSVLDMLAGKRDDILSCSLRDGEGADEYVSELEATIAPITAEGRGHPARRHHRRLAPHQRAQHALRPRSSAQDPRLRRHENLPMALTAAFDLQAEDENALCESMVSEGRAALAQMGARPGHGTTRTRTSSTRATTRQERRERPAARIERVGRRTWQFRLSASTTAMIHGQTVTRWALEYPCDGIIAVNDAAASNPVLKSAYKSAAPDKKTFVWTMEHFKEKAQTVRDSRPATSSSPRTRWTWPRSS